MSESRWVVNNNGVMKWDVIYHTMTDAVNAVYHMNAVWGGDNEVMSIEPEEGYVIINKWLSRYDVEHSPGCGCEDCIFI